MKIRQVALNGGPYDGRMSLVSHDTAVHAGEVYVWDGGEDKNRFVHAKTALAQLDPQAWDDERRRMSDWMEHPSPEPPSDIPAWRVNAWLQLLRYDAV